MSVGDLMKTEIYDIIGMHCAACSSAIERVTRKIEGVKVSEVNLPLNILNITYDESLVNEEIICAKIKKAGFSASLKAEEKKEIKEEKNNYEKISLICSIVLSVILLYVSMGQMLFDNLYMFDIFSMNSHPINFAILQMFITMIIMFIERRFLISGFKSLIHLNPNMDSLVLISCSTCFIYSFINTLLIDYNIHYVHNLYYESSALILTLISVGKYLEGSNKEKTKLAITKLMDLTPKKAILVNGDKHKEVDTQSLKVGDIILVRSGSVISLDGVVIKGSATINEAMITGESMPVLKEVEDSVIGGTILLDGLIYVSVTSTIENSTLTQIVKFVSDAQLKKAPIAKMADKVASVFVPTVIAISLISFLIWIIGGSELSFALKIFTSILVIACPCSMGLATPLSIVVSTGIGANNGILIRNGVVLENMHKTSVVVFDKTGTLTTGEFNVCDIVSDTLTQNELLELVIPLEKLSNHPIAFSICKEEEKRNLKIEKHELEFNNINGMGIVSPDLIVGSKKLMDKYLIDISNILNLDLDGKSVVYVAKDNKLIGYITLSDTCKDSATKTIKELNKMNIKTVMLTGDNKTTALSVAKKLNITDVYYEVLPHEKEQVITKLQQNNECVMMIGDGINDSIALTKADIGVCVKNGSDIAIDCADVILMKDNLLDIIKAIKLSKYSIRNIKQNLFWAFCYNILCIPIAAGVLYKSFSIMLSPMIGAFAMSMSSLFVVLNALRLKKAKIG